MTSEKAEARRRHSAAVKAQVVYECAEPGTSVAKVAMSHGINPTCNRANDRYPRYC